jgi:thiol-disulfide isomerase/thioredoxin
MKQLFSRVLPLFLVITSQFATAKKTTIKGSTTSFATATITAYHYGDLLSLREEKLAQTIIDEKGHFTLSFDLERMERISLRIEDKTASLYVPEGEVVNLILSYDPGLNQNKLFDRQLSVQFSFPKPNEMNGLVMHFMRDYRSFLIANEGLFLTKKAIPAIENFAKQETEKYKNRNVHFDQFLTYNLAAMYDAALGSKTITFNNHFNRHPIAHTSFDYMQLFKQFYAKRFHQLVLGKRGMELLASINGAFNYKKLKEIVLQDRYIAGQDTLGELFIILGLGESYYDKELFQPQKVIRALEHISANGMTGTHRKMAKNTIHRLTYLTKGTTAPAFEFKDEKGQSLHLNDVRGKITYVQFWSSSSATSLREMVLLQVLHQKYQATVNFISMNMDTPKVNWKKSIANKNYAWTFGTPLDLEDVKTAYRLRGYPAYLLLNQEGKIVSYPAAAPTGSIEKTLYDLSKP